MLYSSTDYGDAAKMTDEQVIEMIRTTAYGAKDGRIVTQVINVTRSKDDLRLADFLLVNVTRNGYSVRAGFDN